MEGEGNGGAMSVGVPVTVGGSVNMEPNGTLAPNDSGEIQIGQVLVPEGEVGDKIEPNDIPSDNSKQEADSLMDYAKSNGVDEALERFANGDNLDVEGEAEESVEKDSREVDPEIDDASKAGSEKVDVAVQEKVEDLSERLVQQTQENSELRALLDAYASVSLEELLKMLLEEKNKEKEKEQEKQGLFRTLLIMLIEFIIGTLKEGGKTAVSEMKPKYA